MSRIVRDVTVPVAPAAPQLITPGLDLQRQQDAADALGVARCPCCRGPLVVRMGRRGPYYQCQCRDGLFAPPKFPSRARSAAE